MNVVMPVLDAQLSLIIIVILLLLCNYAPDAKFQSKNYYYYYVHVV